MSPDCKVIESFFPEKILLGLIGVLKESEDRKIKNWFDSDAHLPPELVPAIHHAERKLELKFNYVLLKWYRCSDPHESAAYEFHIDPKRLQSIPLVLITLSGSATLEYKDTRGKTRSVPCCENQANILKSNLLHRVSPPTSPDGERLYCLLGFDTDFATRPSLAM